MHQVPQNLIMRYLEAGGLLEVRRADTLADDVPVRAARDEVHLLGVHDLLELLPDFPHLPHRLPVDEVLLRPRRRIPATENSIRHLAVMFVSYLCG